jgi:hypothetical protein
MSRTIPYAVLAVCLLISPAFAQRGPQGPILLPPANVGGGSYGVGQVGPSYITPYGGDQQYHHHRFGGDRFGDPRMAEIAGWYRQLLGRDLHPVEEHNWRLHLRDGGTMEGVLAMILAGDEFYNQSGRRFEDWFTAVAAATGYRMSRAEAAQWRQEYRRSPDRVSFVRWFLANQAGVGVVEPGFGYEVPWNGGAQHHTAGFGPRHMSEADLIAEWYRTYFGREIAGYELDKWLSDRARGMPLDEVYASVLAAPEWYARTGSPTNWVASTLEALGTRADHDSVGYWSDRLRRHRGDRFRTALEMVRSTGGRPGAFW